LPRHLFRLALCAIAGLFASLVAPAAAHDSASGGASAPERPEISGLRCTAEHPDGCPRGTALRIEGEHLARARTVVFLGRPGTVDDQRAAATRAEPHRLVVRVPVRARSGPVQVVSAVAGRSAPSARLEVAAPLPAAATPQVAVAPAPEAVFPVRGRHSYGTHANGFGGGRGHQGHDVFAACGTPVVAARAGEVKLAAWHGAAGNYVVIDAADGTSQAYMHLERPATLAAGDVVEAGDRIGTVGATGRASGCHLHFEYWTAPGWYAGGTPIDPLARLKRWDAADA
jgi:murein DD-endopeptidase MepM/ murein hydrolase activator NlpD